MITSNEIRSYASIFLILLPIYSQANALHNLSSNEKYVKHFEVSAAGGLDWYSIPNSSLIISPSETDSDHVSDTSLKGAWKAGLGYYFLKTTYKIEHISTTS